MSLYVFTYCREQRATIAVEAKSEDEALEFAEIEAGELELESPDDESDDPGVFYLSEVQGPNEVKKTKPVIL